MKMLYFPKKSLTNKAKILAKISVNWRMSNMLWKALYFFLLKTFFMRKKNGISFQIQATYHPWL
jgi:hypothetical protein